MSPVNNILFALLLNFTAVFTCTCAHIVFFHSSVALWP